MYHVLYYFKGEGGCQCKKGFYSREAAYNWVAEQGDNIDWYSIEESDF